MKLLPNISFQRSFLFACLQRNIYLKNILAPKQLPIKQQLYCPFISLFKYLYTTQLAFQSHRFHIGRLVGSMDAKLSDTEGQLCRTFPSSSKVFSCYFLETSPPDLNSNQHEFLVGFPCGNLHYNELRRILPCYMSVQVLVLRWQWPLLAKY